MAYVGFFGPKRHPWGRLSNFAPSPFVQDGQAYATVEHYFQAQKFLDPEYRRLIATAPNPHSARELGRQRAVHPTTAPVINAHRARGVKIRDDWEAVKDSVMYTALLAKFRQNPVLLKLLLSTGEFEIKEESPFDNYWAVGRDGLGRNRLGELLQQARKELRDEQM